MNGKLKLLTQMIFFVIVLPWLWILLDTLILHMFVLIIFTVRGHFL